MSSANNHKKRACRGRTSWPNSAPMNAGRIPAYPESLHINLRSFGERIKKAVREAETSYTRQEGGNEEWND